MAFFVLCSDITIGSFRFGGVHDVRVKRSIHSYAESATIKLPAICKVVKGKRASSQILKTAEQFREGDAVTIKLGYNFPHNLKKDNKQVGDADDPDSFIYTVFQGFVKSKKMGMPLIVECEGYVRKLRQDVSVQVSEKSIKVSELLRKLETDRYGKPTGIRVEVKNDMNLVGVKIPGGNGVEVIEAVKRMSLGTLNIFFKTPTTLWCGLTYTQYSRGEDPFGLGEVKYRLGFNVPRDSGLKERGVAQERVKIVFVRTDINGNKNEVSSKDSKGVEQRTSVSNVHDLADLEKMVQEKQFKANYTGYEGSLSAFLQPWCEPGYMVSITDKLYPKRDGKYMAEATEVTFGKNGARIKIDIGPQLGFGQEDGSITEKG